MKYTAQIVKDTIAARYQAYFAGDRQYLRPYAVNLVTLPESVTKPSLEAIARITEIKDNIGCMTATEIFLVIMHKIYMEARMAGIINELRHD